jgi:cytochrome c-type biogenesis protein CcmH
MGDRIQELKRFRPLRFVFTILAAVIVLGLAVAPGRAQGPSADDINEIAKKLSCPTCTGINVADCPTETCAQWRAEIKRRLVDGQSESEILDYFAARYGDHVLQVPPKRGFFLWIWLLPVLALLAGLVFLGLQMKKWRSRHDVDLVEVEQQDSQDEYLRRVQQDLEKGNLE